MQIIYDNTRNGELKVQIDSLDDLWLLYNILQPGDRIKGRTVRRVVVHEGDAGTRKPMNLLITAEKIEFHEFTNRLRVLGSILEGPEDWVSTGDHHTFNLEPGKKITIFKDQWFRNDIERIRRNLKKKENSMILCVAIESGLANLALLSNYSLTPITEIKENIPGKRYKKQMHQQAMDNFFQNVTLVIIENLSRYNINLIVVCGPGFIKEEYVEKFGKQFIKDKEKIATRALNASSGELSAIYEILRNGKLATQKKDLKIAQDEMLMTTFIERLGKDNNTVIYGLDQTYQAAQMGAVENLLICDTLLRNSDVKLREKIEDTLNSCEKTRGTVHILSTANPAGDQLENYGKIAGILRYRIEID
ncbi:MAG: mRNA surveillance protein pelota [Promethearchaeota archaeon]